MRLIWGTIGICYVVLAGLVLIAWIFGVIG
jgi:hypothetical protein